MRICTACHEAREAFSSRAAVVVSRALEAAEAEACDSMSLCDPVDGNALAIRFHMATLLNADKAIGLRALATLAQLSSRIPAAAVDEDLPQTRAVRISREDSVS